MAKRMFSQAFSTLAVAGLTALFVTRSTEISRVASAMFDAGRKALDPDASGKIPALQPVADTQVAQASHTTAVLPALAAQTKTAAALPPLKTPTVVVNSGSGTIDAENRKAASGNTTRVITKSNDLRLAISSEVDGVFVLASDFGVVIPPTGNPAIQANVPKDLTYSLDPNQELARITVIGTLTRTANDTAHSNSNPTRAIEITFDRAGPKLLSALYDDSRPSDAMIVVTFDADDLDLSSVKNTSLILQRFDPASNRNTKVDVTIKTDPLRTDRVYIPISSAALPPGDYEISGKEGVVDSDLIKDLVGNKIGDGTIDPQVVRFTVLPPRKTGSHVEFPQFTPPKVEGDRERPFNPDDFVVTRVARLYYFRDAARVAQIINRNVQSYNRAAVTQAQRVAEEARKTADTRTDERRAAERAAIRAADDLRRLENNLEATKSALAEAKARKDNTEQIDAAKAKLKSEIDDIDEQLTAPAGTEPEKAKAEKLKKDRADLVLARDRLIQQKTDLDQEARLAPRSADQLAGDVTKLQGDIETKRNAMLDAQERSDGAQAKEDRSKEDQFRKEVAAAHEDPDIYVPGKIDSVDPVTQVSLSVIGEGLIQLRGPIKGVNKIREMINQMDSPLGQVKIGIFTVQVNGERGDRMDKVARRIEGHVDLSRFLTSHSLMLLRRSVQEVAGEIAKQSYDEFDGHTQVDRDRRYLYAFFGRDFIDSLFSMHSEFLYTGNRLLSLNSMDNISLNRALFVLALAKNEVRQCILERFQQHIECDLPQAEYDYRISTRLNHSGKHTLKHVSTDAAKHYIFRNFRSLFEGDLSGTDTLNPLQLEFLRLAQIFKSQMVSEVELKQRTVERGLIQDRANDETQQFQVLQDVQSELRGQIKQSLFKYAKGDDQFESALRDVDLILAQFMRDTNAAPTISRVFMDLNQKLARPGPAANMVVAENQASAIVNTHSADLEQWLARMKRYSTVAIEQGTRDRFNEAVNAAAEATNKLADPKNRVGATAMFFSASGAFFRDLIPGIQEVASRFRAYRAAGNAVRLQLTKSVGRTLRNEENDTFDEAFASLEAAYLAMHDSIVKHIAADDRAELLRKVSQSHDSLLDGRNALDQLRRSVNLKDATRARLDQRKLLDHLIDEKEEKHIELVEGTRSYVANMDAYLKRLTVALEDDCRIQFYDPAFEKIRGAAREYDVELGQVERTTILTNNRQLAKVDPAATMEFDLPKRDILITEAMKGAKALVQDYGALLQDPTFLTATNLLSGSPPTAGFAMNQTRMPGLPNQGFQNPLVKDVLPTLPSSTQQQLFGQTGMPQSKLGANLEALIPDPAIYKFETGTGFEIRPVIQPDGDSIVYDFTYMYTTNVREPVRPDEKHLGRIKRQNIHTQVQTSTYELREISRYTVALKAARTARGVPLFEDIPGLGILFRPLPSAESSLQQNIILGQSTVYPTLFDLMGLRWAPYVVDLDDEGIQEEEFVVRGRRKNITDWTFDEASGRVDDFLRVSDRPQLFRPDLYRTPDRPSLYHPDGHNVDPYFKTPDGKMIQYADPTGRNFGVPDPRPSEYRQPGFNTESGRLDRVPADHAMGADGIEVYDAPAEGPYEGRADENVQVQPYGSSMTPSAPTGAAAPAAVPMDNSPSVLPSPEPHRLPDEAAPPPRSPQTPATTTPGGSARRFFPRRNAPNTSARASDVDAATQRAALSSTIPNPASRATPRRPNSTGRTDPRSSPRQPDQKQTPTGPAPSAPAKPPDAKPRRPSLFSLFRGAPE